MSSGSGTKGVRLESVVDGDWLLFHDPRPVKRECLLRRLSVRNEILRDSRFCLVRGLKSDGEKERVGGMKKDKKCPQYRRNTRFQRGMESMKKREEVEGI